MTEKIRGGREREQKERREEGGREGERREKGGERKRKEERRREEKKIYTCVFCPCWVLETKTPRDWEGAPPAGRTGALQAIPGSLSLRSCGGVFLTHSHSSPDWMRAMSPVLVLPPDTRTYF